MSVDDNKAAFHRFCDCVNRRDFEAMLDLVAVDYVNHNRAAERGPGALGAISTYRELAGLMPNLKVTAVNVIGEGSLVAAHLGIAGTHTSGRNVAVTMTEMVRFTDGKMVERWGNFDEAKLARDLAGATAGSK